MLQGRPGAQQAPVRWERRKLRPVNSGRLGREDSGQRWPVILAPLPEAGRHNGCRPPVAYTSGFGWQSPHSALSTSGMIQSMIGTGSKAGMKWVAGEGDEIWARRSQVVA